MDLAFDVNCRGAVNVAQAAKQQGSRLLFVSTDYVFDGTKKAPYTTGYPRSPRSVYGKSKAEAEEWIGQILPDSCIVRTSWLFGAGGKCFPDTILKLAATRSELEVVGDQRGSPTYAIDLAHALICNSAKRMPAALCTPPIAAIARGMSLPERLSQKSGSRTMVKETSSDKFVRPAPRPKYSRAFSGELAELRNRNAGLAGCASEIPGGANDGRHEVRYHSRKPATQTFLQI